MAYGYERMSSLVPELVKKRCKSINAETNVSVNLLKNALAPVRSAHFAMVAPFASVSGFAAAAA
jgi:hypothetical protein